MWSFDSCATKNGNLMLKSQTIMDGDIQAHGISSTQWKTLVPTRMKAASLQDSCLAANSYQMGFQGVGDLDVT